MTETRIQPDFTGLKAGSGAYSPSPNHAFDIDLNAQRLGLYVEGSKILYKGGEFHAVGLNYYDGFIYPFDTGDNDNTAYVEHFNIMRRYNIPYVRVNFSQFWPFLYTRYAAHKAEYYLMMDRMVRAAEEIGVGLIPSLFWNPLSVCDFVDEPMNEWGNPDSKTRAFMKQYVKEVVTRYKGSPAVWMWEFSNEYNLYCDLDNAVEQMQIHIFPQLGTRPVRDERDCMTTEIMTDCMKAFAAEVRKYDDTRAITSGNTNTREGACRMHETRGGETRPTDTREEYEKILALQNPAELEVLSIHFYYDEPREDKIMRTTEGMIRACKRLCDKWNRPLFIGEFAGDVAVFGEHQVKGQFYRVFNTIREEGIPLSCVWSAWLNEDRYVDNIILHPDLAYMREELNDYNTEMFTRYGMNIWK